MVVYVDTNIFIYLLEDSGELGLRVADMLDDFKSRNHSFVTSTLTLTEFLAGSLTSETVFSSMPRLSFVPLEENIAIKAGQMQRASGLKVGDAIHVATAEHAGASVFFTNDQALAVRLPSDLQAMTL